MSQQQAQGQLEHQEKGWRPRCYGCYRPMDRCFCNQIPTIHNRTNVLIFQHMRERFHPFNTARILRRSLLNSRLFVDHLDGLRTALSLLTLSDAVGLLYPGNGSQLLENLSGDERPEQLVILDGTWHHTKTLFREIPQLQSLPKYRLAPTQPSRYGLRREPHVSYLSTLEATVAALRFLEPETLGFEQLVAAFDYMVANQLSHPRSEDSCRRKIRPRATLNIPKVLRNSLDHIVVVYGEMTPGVHIIASAKGKSCRAPVVWVAERLGTGERFERAIMTTDALPEAFCKHLELSHNAFDEAVSIDDFRREWETFLRQTDTLAYYYPNTPRLLNYIGGTPRPRIYLKSIHLHRDQKIGTLEELLTALNVAPSSVLCKGRAGRRLSNTIALVRYLHNCDVKCP